MFLILVDPDRGNRSRINTEVAFNLTNFKKWFDLVLIENTGKTIKL